jgi:Lon protease-like protein
MDTQTPYRPDDLPGAIPVFPLDGVLLLPRGNLPLNIFEPRYLAMVEDALKADRIIGMVQPSGPDALYEVGCAGRITSFHETDDNRYLITLTGLSRFRIRHELPQQRGYRRVEADWAGFADDLKPVSAGIDLDRARLHKLLSSYFELQGLSCQWDAIDNAPDDKLVTCLSMICPLEASEKQALLEAPCCKTRAEMFMAMLELAVRGGDASDTGQRRQ